MDNTWNNINSLVIYGAGQVAERFIEKIIKDFNIKYIIDKEKCGLVFYGVPVYSLSQKKQELKQSKLKIVVMASRRVYLEIKNELENNGFHEFFDFCRIEQFVVEWYRENRNQRIIIQLNTAVTTYCTLNCEKCNMFMPYYKNKRHHFSYEEMREDIDLLLRFVDYVFLYSFLGGEPFLNSELYRIISYVAITYKDRIGKLGITTNGMVIPDDKTIDTLKKYNVLVVISDYTLTIPYEKKICDFISLLEKNGITYKRNIMTEWKDFGYPIVPFCWEKENTRKHMIECSPLFHGINDKKIYYCHVVWSAEKAGIYDAPESDFIRLDCLDEKNKDDCDQVIDFLSGKMKNGYLQFCRVCGGCGSDNKMVVKPAIQKNTDYERTVE